MKKIVKKGFAVLLSAALVTTLLPGNLGNMKTVQAEEGGHSHDNLIFEEWTETDSLPTEAGNYCLTNEVTMPEDYKWEVPKGETNLCLHGHDISKPVIGKGGSAIGIGEFNYHYDKIPDPTTLNIFDCSEGEPGTISGWNGPFYVRDGNLTIHNGIIKSDRDDNIIYIADRVSGNVTINGGKIISGSDEDGSAVIVVKSSSSSLTINGGEIEGYNGILNSGKLTITDATITANGGTAITNRGLSEDGWENGVAEIKDGSFHSDDDTIINSGKLTIAGGTITSTDACGIYNTEAYDEFSAGELDVTAGTITAAHNGIYNSGNLEVSGGNISGGGTYFSIYNSSTGDAKISGGIITHSGTDCIKNVGELNVSGGTIKSEKGAGVYNTGGTLGVSKGNISGSSYGIYHGNAQNASSSVVFNLSGSPVIKGNTADIYLLKDKYITVTETLSNITPYSVRMGNIGVFTDSGDTDNNDPDKFTAASAHKGYAVIKDESSQLALVSKTYTITYDKGTKGTGEEIPAVAKPHGTDIILSDSTFEREGYEQTGWATTDGGEKEYELGGTYSKNEDVTLYPYWECKHDFEWHKDDKQHWQVCTRSDCGQETDAEDHSFGDWITDTEATETTDGVKHRECSVCRYMEEEIIPATRTSGNIDKEVEIGENAPKVSLPMDTETMADAVLTDNEKKDVEDGTNIKILLTVENADATVSTEDRQKIKEGASYYTVGQYLDINLIKVVTDKDDNEKSTNIFNTNKPIRIRITIPENLKGNGNYAVVRLHEGKTTLLEDLDDDPDTITIETDCFSTYALVYTEITDEDRVTEAKKIVEKVLDAMTVTNDTTKENIQQAVDAALKEAGFSDVTAMVGELTKKNATEGVEGSLTGTVTITKEEASDSISINKTIAKLPLDNTGNQEDDSTTTPPADSTVTPEQQEKNEIALNEGLKVSQKGKKIYISWGKVKDADGYMVYVQYCGRKFSFKPAKTVKSAAVTKVTVSKINGKKLDLKKNYKVYVAAYKLVNGKKSILGKTVVAHIVGKNNKAYTNVKQVKVANSKYTLQVGKTAQIKAKTVLVNKKKKQLSDVHAKEFRYKSTDTGVATVSAKGKITAKGRGRCVIYVYARNGYAKKVNVTVK